MTVPEEFIFYLASKVNRELKDGAEKYVLMFGLYCLRAEASLPKQRRKQEMVKFIWKYVHPRIEKLGYLEEFKKEDKIKSDVKYFVAGSLLGL